MIVLETGSHSVVSWMHSERTLILLLFLFVERDGKYAVSTDQANFTLLACTQDSRIPSPVFPEDRCMCNSLQIQPLEHVK